MSTDHYADAGLPYLPIDRIDEFPACKDGREVLMRVEYGYGEERLLTLVCTFNADDDLWVDQDGCYQLTPTHFLPASLAPIGEHVAVEYAVCRSRGKRRFSVSGHSDHGVSEWIGDGKDVVQTGVVRIPIRRPPHGEAL